MIKFLKRILGIEALSERVRKLSYTRVGVWKVFRL